VKVIRAAPGALALSLESDGDRDVVVDGTTCAAVLAVLARARDLTGAPDGA
jgi:hypothetical protein